MSSLIRSSSLSRGLRMALLRSRLSSSRGRIMSLSSLLMTREGRLRSGGISQGTSQPILLSR